MVESLRTLVSAAKAEALMHAAKSSTHRTREIILWEHFGRMGDEEYVKNALQKVHAYEQNGYSCGKNLIITEESAECPLFMSSVDYWIDRMLV